MRLPLLALGLSIPLVGSPATSEGPRFAVEAKTKLAKTFDSRIHLASTRMQVTIEGHDDPIEGGDVEITMDNTGHLEVTDEYLAVEKGRPVRLQRTFDKLEGTQHQTAKGAPGEEEDGGEDMDEERKEESALEGKTVLFVWNEDGSRFDATFAGDKGDEALLEDLVEDMDFRQMLPKGEVAKDEAWDVDPKAFDVVLSPGGDLKLEPVQDGGNDAEAGEDSKLGKEIRRHLEGTASATWKGVREEEGRRLGVIALQADLTSEGEIDPEGEPASKVGFKAKFEFEGELLWDLAAGHFRAFQTGGKAGLSITTTARLDAGERSLELRQVLDFEGELSFRASVR